MPKLDFATLVFRGERFAGGVMPVDVLAELSAYRTLVLAVAKQLFLTENPGRQRLPKGFESSFQLVLDGMSEGSAVPHIARVVHDDTLPVGYLFDRARDSVEEGIAAATHGAVLPRVFSREVLTRFAPFGRTLSATESIVVAKPQTRDGAEYDRAVRTELLRLSMSSYEDDVDLVGDVREADKDSASFALRTVDGQRIDVRSAPVYFHVAVKSFDESSLVRLRGTGLYDASGNLQRVISTADVSPVEEDEGEIARIGCRVPIDEQIEILANLPAQWYDEDSDAYDRRRYPFDAREAVR